MTNFSLHRRYLTTAATCFALATSAAVADEAAIVHDDFSGEAVVASGNEAQLGSSGWWSWTGPEAKTINADDSGVLVLTEADGEEKFFDSIVRVFEAVTLEDGESLEVAMKLTVREGERGSIADSRDTLRITLTDGDAGAALYLPTGENQYVGLGPTTKMLGTKVPPLALRQATPADEARDISIVLRRDGDRLLANVTMGETSSDVDLADIGATTAFSRLALTNGRSNFELVVDDVVIRRVIAE
jgi:hypothetical protein